MADADAADRDVRIVQVGPERLADYTRVPIAFRVAHVLAIEAIDGGLGGLRLVERPVAEPYVKDYDGALGGESAADGVAGDAGEGPLTWPGQFDLSAWGLFLALAQGGEPVGAAAVAAAAVACHTPGAHMLEDRPDLAMLWDIRVRPDRRGHGIGRALFRHAAAWARGQGCRQLKIETQDINPAACRFYAAQGCHLGAIHRHGYAAIPAVAHEAMLLWYLDL